MTEKKTRILILEDDLSSQQYYAIIFDEIYLADIVSNVADAKARLAESYYDVAVIDISLPGEENGIDFIRYLNHLDGKKPVAIALTAHAFPQHKRDALDAGAMEFFTKPIMSDVLLKAIEKHLT